MNNATFFSCNNYNFAILSLTFDINAIEEEVSEFITGWRLLSREDILLLDKDGLSSFKVSSADKSQTYWLSNKSEGKENSNLALRFSIVGSGDDILMSFYNSARNNPKSVILIQES